MIQIKDGQIAVNSSRKLTPRQLATLRGLDESEQQQYLLSLLGVIKRRVYAPKLKISGLDSMKSKTPGNILRQFQRLTNTENFHGPGRHNPGEWVGVEIECIIPGDDFNNEEAAWNALKVELQASRVRRCSMKYDGSINADDDGGYGVEVTVVFNSADGFKDLERVFEALKRMGCRVNDSCGLHVHLDARHLDLKGARRIGRRLGRALPVIKYLTDDTRHDNEYCRMGVSKSKPESNRYYAINLTAFHKYKTVEIRLHGGSTDSRKVINWIKVLKATASTPILRPLSTFQEFLDTVKIDDTLVAYMEKRIKRLWPEQWNEVLNPPLPVPRETTVHVHGNAVISIPTPTTVDMQLATNDDGRVTGALFNAPPIPTHDEIQAEIARQAAPYEELARQALSILSQDDTTECDAEYCMDSSEDS